MSANFLDARLPDRFWDKATPCPMSGCWLWHGSIHAKGYGQYGAGGVNAKAHRIAFIALVGPIHDGLHLDHLCRQRCCVNPAHLEPVTPAEDVQVAKAQRDDALAMVRDLLAILRREAGYRRPSQQATMRGADALLAEHPVPRQRLA